jgi:serine/threonine protein kinase
LKFIDFGTAKDLMETNLNGQEFVGTPEYMSPQTVSAKKTTNVGIESDIWALGALLYQMVLGKTPFGSASHYLTFLRIKRGRVNVSI